MEVVPGVFLGFSGDAHRFSELRRQNVTHILSIQFTGDKASPASSALFPDHFVYKELCLTDTNFQRIIPLIPPVATWVQSALNQGGRVLVNDRTSDGSAALLIGYLIHVQGLDCNSALKLLRQRKPELALSHSFAVQLQEYEAIALARQQVRNPSVACRPQRRPCPFVAT